MIQVFKPRMKTDSILSQMRHPLEMGWIGMGNKTAEFEKKIGEYLGLDNDYVTAVNSCTAALHLAVKSLGLPPGARVLTTPITFISSNHVLLYEGLEPVFCDVDRYTGHIKIDRETVFRENVCAAIVVHMAGYPVDIPEDLGIPVIEDCAHAFGAEYSNGKKVGDSNNICCFSFHAVKNLPMGDGGAITGPDKWFKKMRWMGIDKDTYSRSGGGYAWEYDVSDVGYKYHMNDITAVIGIEQLKTIDEDNARRKTIADYYRANIKNAEFPDYKSDRKSSYHFYPLFFEHRNKVYKALLEHEIFPGMHYKRNDKYKMYKTRYLPGAEEWERHELTLPLHLELSDADVEHVVEVVNSI